MRATRMLVLLFAALVFCSHAVSLHLRSVPADQVEKQLAVAVPVKAPLVHTSLAGSSSEALSNASIGANTTAGSNATVPFRLSSKTPAVGKVFALYYSTASGQKVTEIEARTYKPLAAAPSNEPVFDPLTGYSLVRQSHCNLRLSQVQYMTATRKYNLRMAEVAICELFFDSPCGPNAGKGCEIEMFAPLPYDSDQEKDIGAGMALTAHSLLCAQRVESWKRDSCAIVRDKAAIAAGLQQTGSGIKLKPINGALIDLKMDATYELVFKEAVFASPNKPDYQESNHYQKKDDVLAWQRSPPQAVFCKDLSCLVAKFQRR